MIKMETKKQILVVEDKEQHLADARAYFGGLEGVAATYVSTLADAERELATGQYNGLISDVFFPMGYEGVEKQQRADALMEMVQVGYERTFTQSREGMQYNSIKKELARYQALQNQTGVQEEEDEQIFTAKNDLHSRVRQCVRGTDKEKDFGEMEIRQIRNSGSDEDNKKLDDRYLDTAKQFVARYDAMIASVEDWKGGNGIPPLGVLVVEKAKEAQIPVVYCTDLWHHSTLAEPVNQLGNAKMIDAFAPNSPKNWEKAYQTLVGDSQ